MDDPAHVVEAPRVAAASARKNDPRKKALIVVMMLIASLFAIALLVSSLVQTGEGHHKHKTHARMNEKYIQVTRPPSLEQARRVVRPHPLATASPVRTATRSVPGRSRPPSGAETRTSLARGTDAKIAQSAMLVFHTSGSGPRMNAQAQYDANLALKIRLARKLIAARQKEEAMTRGLTQQPGLAQMLAHALPRQTGGSAGGPPTGATTVTRTHEAQQFLHNPGGVTRSSAGVTVSPPPVGPTLMPGSVVPAVLTTTIDSDLPGMITARTVHPVYDSIHEQTVVIPRGSMITGYYSTDINAGQTRILASFTEIIFPDGWTVHLGGMTAADSYGRAGMSAQVNNHFWTQFGASFLIAALTTFLPTTNSVTLVGTGTTPTQGIYGAAGQALINVQQSMLAQYQNLPPTLVVHRGFRFNIMVSRPITLPPEATRPGEEGP